MATSSPDDTGGARCRKQEAKPVAISRQELLTSREEVRRKVTSGR